MSAFSNHDHYPPHGACNHTAAQAQPVALSSQIKPLAVILRPESDAPGTSRWHSAPSAENDDSEPGRQLTPQMENTLRMPFAGADSILAPPSIRCGARWLCDSVLGGVVELAGGYHLIFVTTNSQQIHSSQATARLCRSKGLALAVLVMWHKTSALRLWPLSPLPQDPCSSPFAPPEPRNRGSHRTLSPRCFLL